MAAKTHDAISKRFLTNIDVAVDFLKSHLPTHIKSRCDFATLRIEPTSFVEEELRQHVSDVLYSLKIDDKDGLIYCLVESQNIPLKLMPLRIIRYLVSALKLYAENNIGKPLPVIVPILLYTGKDSPYPYSLDLFDCFTDPQLARETMLNTKLIDVSLVPDEEIKTHGHAAFLEIITKHIRDRDIMQLVHIITALLKDHPLTRDLYQDMLRYVIGSGESHNYQEFIQVLLEEATEYKEDTVTIAEQLELKGEYKKAMIIAQNMLQEGSNVEFIKKVTGLSEKELSNIVKKSH